MLNLLNTKSWWRKGEWRYSSTILDLGIRWRWAVSFTPQPLYSRRKIPRQPLDRRLREPQDRPGCCEVEQNLLPLPGIEPGHSPSLYQLSHFHTCMSLQPLWTLATFQLLNLYTVRRTPWTEDQPIARPLPTHRTSQTQNKRTETSMSQAGFEPKILVLERAKTVHALNRTASIRASEDSSCLRPRG
jgi:hypothetical protein